MVDFRAMSPVDPQRRKEQVKKVTRLMNGARFQFRQYNFIGEIVGIYLDYAGEWTQGLWNDKGRVADRKFAEMDLDWSSARES